MTASRHPSEATLIAYAAGSLDEAMSVVVATHLAICPACRRGVSLAERVGGRLLEALPDAPLAPEALGRALAEIVVSDQSGPEPVSISAPPEGLDALPRPLGHYRLGGWRRVAPGLARIRVLPRRAGRASLDLIRVAPGRAMPRHSHPGLELTCVLAGAYRDQYGRVAAGDLVEHGPDENHRPVAEAGEACVCLFALERPIRLSGVARLLQPFFAI